MPRKTPGWRTPAEVFAEQLSSLSQARVTSTPEPAQYVSIAFTERLVQAGIDASVGSVSDACDNALAETTVGSFKTEMIHTYGPWRDAGHVEVAALEWVDFFKNRTPPRVPRRPDPRRSREASRRSLQCPARGRMNHQTESPDSPGGGSH